MRRAHRDPDSQLALDPEREREQLCRPGRLVDERQREECAERRRAGVDHGLEVRVVVVVEMRRETDRERRRVPVECLGPSRRHHLSGTEALEGGDEGIGLGRPARADRGAEDVQQTASRLVRCLRCQTFVDTAM